MKTLRFHSFLPFFCALIALGSSACLDKKKAVVAKSGSSSSTSSSGFTGATSAVNLATDGISIQVSWGAAKSPYVTYNIYAVQADDSLTLLKSKVPLNLTSYVQNGLISGNIYSYIVRAVKEDGTEDGNSNVVSTLAYAGINKVGGATGVSLNSAFINFTAVGSRAQGYRIYCTNPNGAVTINLSYYNVTDIQKQITGLYSGTTYKCQVNAIYTDFWGSVVTDSNAVIYSFQTISKSFTQSTPAYQGVILVQAYGDAPTAPTSSNAPVAIPSPIAGITTRQVSITWKSFNIPYPENAQYRLVRVRQSGVIDMNTTTPCTSTTVTSCQVCVSSSGANALSRTCIDPVGSIGKSPNRYEYAVSLIVEPNAIPPLAEELPTLSSDKPFRVLVPIPPDNMVLVHRDSVNYEKCAYMNLASDPMNNQRCAYTGFGSIPYSTTAFGIETPLTLVGNPGTPYDNVVNNGAFYDFGYNLFIDRWEAGCNWSPSAATATGGTGMCGAGGTSGDCFGSTGAPLAGIGIEGNVYYDSNLSECWRKISGVWTRLQSSAAVDPSLLVTTMTSVPSTTVQKPPIGLVAPVSGTLYANLISNRMCQSNVDPNYGLKRLPTRREQMAANAFQWLPGEPNQMSPTTISALQSGLNLPISQSCNGSNHNGLAAPATVNVNQSFPVGGGTPYYGVMIGSHYTANCNSRFGVQDMVGNVAEHSADIVYCGAGTHTCVGISRDLTFTRQYNFDGVGSNTGPGGTGHGQIGPNYTTTWTFNAMTWGTSYFSTPIGLPFVSNDFGNAMSVINLHSNDATSGLIMSVYTDNGAPAYKDIVSGGSYSGSASPIAMGTYSYSTSTALKNLGFRCALPAE